MASTQALLDSHCMEHYRTEEKKSSTRQMQFTLHQNLYMSDETQQSARITI